METQSTWIPIAHQDQSPQADWNEPPNSHRDPVSVSPSRVSSLAILALIFGVGGLLIVWAPFIGIIGFLLGATAILLGIFGLRECNGRSQIRGKGMAVGGLSLGTLSTVIGLLVFVAFLGSPDGGIMDDLSLGNDQHANNDMQNKNQEEDNHNSGTPMTANNASDLVLHLKDMGAGWQKRSDGGNETEWHTELVRPDFQDPVTIDTYARIFNNTNNATDFFNSTRSNIQGSHSTDNRDVGENAFYYEKNRAWIYLFIHQGNVVWEIEFKGQAGYFWDPNIDSIGEILVAKY